MEVLLVGLVVLAAGCASNESAKDQASPEVPTGVTDAQTNSSATGAELVGRWRRVNRCPELVNALEHAGLGAIGPATVGDYFPETPPAQLEKKKHLCEGAKPIVHYHFFDEAGRFGSLDEHEEQVDDGAYEISDDRTLVISKEFGDVTFEYGLEADKVVFSRVITRAMKKDALADPLEFSAAGWANSMSYPGHAWTRVDCAGWC